MSRTMHPTEAALLMALGLAVAGCNSGPGISVDLRTDLVPSREFVRVETTITEDVPVDAGSMEMGRVIAQNVSSRADYLAGVRIAEIGSLVRGGSYVLHVTLLDAHSIVATRLISVTVTGHTAVTVVVTRNCVGVACPPSTDPMLTECLDEQCVDPRCSATTPEYCPSSTTTCTRDGECVANGCGRASCASGACLVVPDDSHCATGEICWGDFTCIPAPPDGDAGVSPFLHTDGSFPEGDANDGLDDAGPPPSGSGSEICTNGIDDDGDSHIDCSDPQCANYGCDDGNRCTFRDVCVGGSCVGTAIHCASSSICPANACIGARHCRRLPAMAGTACADGVNPQPCNGDYCDGMGHCDQNQRRPDGAYCGATGEFHCCAGLCVDLTSSATNCGGCGVHCQGPCTRIPTTNFGACACTGDANCAVFGPDAWCSPAGRCQCSCGCPRTGACAMRCADACGSSTATCADTSGQDNFCYYPAP